MNRILIIAPHSDDEILGCGGIIAKAIENNDEVFIAIMTNANKGEPKIYSEIDVQKTYNEARQAHEFLGIKDTFFFDFPAPNLDTFPISRIARSINQLISDLSPNIMYIPYRGDLHNDHKVIFEASIVAARPIYSCSVKTILSYETLSETEWAPPFQQDAFIPNVFEIISEIHLENKIKAMKFYKTQLKSYPHARSIEGIKSLAINRGVTISAKYAESFMLIRSIK